MANFGDFWGREKKIKDKIFKMKDKELGTVLLGKIKLISSVVGNFFRRLARLPLVLNRRDKIALLIFVLILAGLLGFKFWRDYLQKTKIVPAVGGTYKEILIGDAQYLNPILAKTDTDKTINQLIYSGLTKVDAKGVATPDLAESWEISADGRVYTFHLRFGVVWQDGIAFSSADVVHTIESIKDNNIKSPYFDGWKDVSVEAPDVNTVIFKLKDPYGPFIYSTLVGIVPDHLDTNSISSSPVGTGPYKFSKVVSGKNNKIQQVNIARSPLYYGTQPYINQIEFQIASDEAGAKKLYDTWPATAISAVSLNKSGSKNYSFSMSRQFGLIFNLRDGQLKDLAFRKKISSVEKFDPAISLTVLVLDKQISVSAAEALKKEYADRGIKITIDKKSAVDFSNLLIKRNFQAVLYGFDTGYDRDPYPFWHSSQITSGNNFSGFSNKQADILLEDARMSADVNVRNQKYDQFFAIFNDQVPAVLLSPQQYQFTIKDDVLGFDSVVGFEPWDHLNNISSWYLKTKRVKP